MENNLSSVYIKPKKKKRKPKWKNIILFAIILVFLTIFIISSINIIKWLIDSKSTEKQINEVQEKVEVVEKEDNESTEIIENEVPSSDPYWDYIKMSLIDVNFTELKEINNSTVGWIQVLGTNVNYPFVQYTDNKFYLNHTFDKSYNSAGWVFMDYRNNKDDFDKNTIIYAHGRADNTMFGSLKRIIYNGWLSNKNNYIVRLSTESENTLWQVFSVYKIPTTNDYLDINFKTDENFLEFANMLLERSAHDFNTTVNENDKILTLSTCFNDTDKVVLHAKLIKREKRQ